MTTLAKEWGGVPRSLLYFVRRHLTDSQIGSIYTRTASKAVQQCQEMLSSLQMNAIPDDAPSQFYFCEPRNNAEPSMQRRLPGASVPTRTLRRLLGEALQKQNNFVKRQFFHALHLPASTRQAAGYIYKSWFHSYFSAGKHIECHWVQGLDGVSSQAGTNLIDTNWDTVKVEKTPYHWVAPTGKNFPGVDSALILAEEIYVFQVTISTRHESPKDGLETLRARLPADLKKIPWRAWRVVFVGVDDSKIKTVANKWVGKLFATDNTNITIGWSEVDPVVKDITYRVCKVG
ncbi:hypothetical protein OG21DRAFT_1011314 [Imleria badia]|nr:hypothetical protein OG21DRAFT_1011314 [Imleria badia]